MAIYSLVEHPRWRELRRYLRVERYDRDRGWAGNVRFRIEVVDPLPPTVRAWLLRMTWPCAACGMPTTRIRERGAWASLYFAATHPIDEKIGCSRGSAAADEYRRIAEDLSHRRPPRAQRTLKGF